MPRSCAPLPGFPGPTPPAVLHPGAGANGSLTSGQAAARGRSSIRRIRIGNRGSPACARSTSSARLCMCLRMNSPATNRVGNRGRLSPAVHTLENRLSRNCQSSRCFATASPNADDPPPLAMIRPKRETEIARNRRATRCFLQSRLLCRTSKLTTCASRSNGSPAADSAPWPCVAVKKSRLSRHRRCPSSPTVFRSDL
jgi:hypothetical protein